MNPPDLAQSLTITWEAVLFILAGVTIVAGGVKVIIGFFSPFKKLKKQVEDNTRHIDADNTRIKSLEHDRGIIFLSLFALIDFAMTGEANGELKRAHNELRGALAEKR